MKKLISKMFGFKVLFFLRIWTDILVVPGQSGEL